MKTIILTKGQVAVVDDSDYDGVSCFKWYADWKTDIQSFYAARSVRDPVTKKQNKILLHRFIVGLTKGDKRQVDHLNGDTLNDCRHNLRIVTSRENQANRKSHRNGRLVGTYLMKDKYRPRPWLAQIKVNGKRKRLGCFTTELEAHNAYLEASMNVPVVVV